MSNAWYKLILLSIAALFGCDAAYPQVVVVNKTGAAIQIKDVSFNGCLWDTVLAYGDATAPQRCLPGEDRVHFQKQDVASYCLEQAEDGTVDGLCLCDGGVSDDEVDSGLTNVTPFWFNYQTVTVHRVDYGKFYRFEITISDMEQDFSVPGPYGH